MEKLTAVFKLNEETITGTFTRLPIVGESILYKGEPHQINGVMHEVETGAAYIDIGQGFPNVEIGSSAEALVNAIYTRRRD
ncbi:hypothetical protein [Shewanella algae]|uniref:Uncharacterized protein n=1 Tax=Shewanella algae TaxID=38313 RepID=A0A380CZ79_9GAMM|nr:hypothetical protein [Shewanella algae]MBO2560447.1 hypothetical protein [Shewanella algae]MBO2607100.1 hypothetical protein [Shewanella algae]MBO2623921.1 hypothetical protein [Shewanella algae]SUJ35114.1 Uncharacterised protein [Shewanella algae]